MNAKDARAVFDACVAIVRKEAGTAQFLLPHVVLAVLTSPGMQFICSIATFSIKFSNDFAQLSQWR